LIKLDQAGAIAATDLRKNKKWCFTIESPVRTYFICAPNEAERESWIKELIAERDRVQGKNKPAPAAASAPAASPAPAASTTAPATASTAAVSYIIELLNFFFCDHSSLIERLLLPLRQSPQVTKKTKLTWKTLSF